MEIIYRCMTCGNNVPIQTEELPKCNICTKQTEMLPVPEDGWDTLPFPTSPIGRKDPAVECQCRAGTCPCGKFVAHEIDKPCNSHELLALKEND